MSLPRLFKSFKPFTAGYLHEMISDWYESELGQAVLEQERKVLDQLLPSMFGYYLLQTGLGRPQQLTGSSTIGHKIFCGEAVYHDAPMASIATRITDLAIQSESVDVALVHHSLDFDSNPHHTLREISRVVIPGGKLIVIGFNPWSVWGLMRFFHPGTTEIPWAGNFISPYRLSDWLSLLDYQVEGCESVFHGLPTTRRRWVNSFGWLDVMGKRWWPQFGAVYTLVATKRVATMTQVKPKRKAAAFVPIPINGIARPAPRKGNPTCRFNDE